MAYMNQEKKARLLPAIKAVCEKYGVKATVSVRNHMTLCITLREGRDILAGIKADKWCEPTKVRESGNADVNVYWIRDHWEGWSADFLCELKDAANAGNHDNSDSQTDYFDVGWYLDIEVGRWDKPYKITE